MEICNFVVDSCIGSSCMCGICGCSQRLKSIFSNRDDRFYLIFTSSMKENITSGTDVFSLNFIVVIHHLC